MIYSFKDCKRPYVFVIGWIQKCIIETYHDPRKLFEICYDGGTITISPKNSCVIQTLARSEYEIQLSLDSANIHFILDNNGYWKVCPFGYNSLLKPLISLGIPS